MANHLSLKTPNREKHTYFSIIFIYFQSEKRWRGASLIKRIKIGGKALKKKFPLYFFNNFHIIFFPFYHKVFDFDFDGAGGGGGFGEWGAHTQEIESVR